MMMKETARNSFKNKSLLNFSTAKLSLAGEAWTSKLLNQNSHCLLGKMNIAMALCNPIQDIKSNDLLFYNIVTSASSLTLTS